MLSANARSIQNRLISSKRIASMLVTLALASVPLTSWSQDEGVTVKLSTSGICHGASSRHYERVKNFKSYSSMQECLDDGGRAPKK
jgi:hypothetical protein